MKVKLPSLFKSSVPCVGAVTRDVVSASPFASVSSASRPEAAATVSPMFLLVR